jgi:hypothetical protein
VNNGTIGENCGEMIELFEEVDDTEVSVHVSFVCLLHLANEHELHLEGKLEFLYNMLFPNHLVLIPLNKDI